MPKNNLTLSGLELPETDFALPDSVQIDSTRTDSILNQSVLADPILSEYLPKKSTETVNLDFSESENNSFCQDSLEKYLDFPCTRCRTLLSFPLSMIDQIISCSFCGQAIIVPFPLEKPEDSLLTDDRQAFLEIPSSLNVLPSFSENQHFSPEIPNFLSFSPEENKINAGKPESFPDNQLKNLSENISEKMPMLPFPPPLTTLKEKKSNEIPLPPRKKTSKKNRSAKSFSDTSNPDATKKYPSEKVSVSGTADIASSHLPQRNVPSKDEFLTMIVEPPPVLLPVSPPVISGHFSSSKNESLPSDFVSGTVPIPPVLRQKKIADSKNKNTPELMFDPAKPSHFLRNTLVGSTIVFVFLAVGFLFFGEKILTKLSGSSNQEANSEQTPSQKVLLGEGKITWLDEKNQWQNDEGALIFLFPVSYNSPPVSTSGIQSGRGQANDLALKRLNKNGIICLRADKEGAFVFRLNLFDNNQSDYKLLILSAQAKRPQNQKIDSEKEKEMEKYIMIPKLLIRDCQYRWEKRTFIPGQLIQLEYNFKQ